MKLTRLLSVAVLAAAASSTQATPITNYLQNSGFETGNLSGWTVGGINGGTGVQTDGVSIPGVTYGSFTPAYQNVRSGNYGFYGVAANSHGEYVSLSQSVNLAAGNYTAGFYLGHDQGGGLGITGAITDGNLGIYVNGVLQSFTSAYGNYFAPGSSPSDFTLFDTSFSWGGGLLDIEYRFSGSGTAQAGFSADDYFLNGASVSVSEPATMALLGLALAGIGFSRKKKAA